MEVKYYVCNHCGNIIEMVKDKGVPVICCGEAMHELKAGVTDAAVEKHVPVYTIEDFCLCDGEQVEEVYAYCNLHGLWKC